MKTRMGLKGETILVSIIAENGIESIALKSWWDEYCKSDTSGKGINAVLQVEFTKEDDNAR